MPFFPAASDSRPLGLVRIVNLSDEPGTLDIVAIDAAGVRVEGVSLAIGAGETAHFDSDDLESGNPDAGLTGATGTGQGDWRLELSSTLDFEVQAYARSADGALAEMYETAARDGDRFRIATFNPGENTEQVGLLWLFNRSDDSVAVNVLGTDDLGRSPGSEVSIYLPPLGARTYTAAELESGAAPGLTGSLGDGVGKWRLEGEADGPVLVMSLISSPTGHLTNLSTLPAQESGGVHRVPLFPPASDPFGRQGFARVINRSDVAGEVHIEAFDGTEWTYETLTLAIGAKETVHFNTNDLELGNPDKGLTGSTGAGEGDWRLELTSELDIEVLSYVRTVGGQGYVTPMHDTAAQETDDLMRYYVPIFHESDYEGLESRLHLLNLGEAEVRAGIDGLDDRGATPPQGDVSLALGPGETRVVKAEELENGSEGLDGRFGKGEGRWRLFVTAQGTLQVMSLGYGADGFLANLSRGNPPATEVRVGAPDLAVETPSVSDGTPEAGETFTLSATVTNRGDGDAEATTLRYYRSTNANISASDIEVGSERVDPLSAGGSSAESVTVTAPSEPGTHYYGACVNAVNGESDTTNNCSSSVAVAVSESSGQPDLVVGTPSVSDSQLSVEEAFTLSATVRNRGEGATASTILRYYRSDDATISSADTPVGTDAVIALGVDGSSGESIGLTAPDDAGMYYYGACIDSVAGESDTTNNCSPSIAITATQPPKRPDLLVGAPSVNNSQVSVGEPITLSATVRNQGIAATPLTTLRYYRSDDATISSADTPAGTDVVIALSAGGSSGQSIGLTAPGDAGMYYYGACIDSVAGESDTTNNCSSSVAVTVSEPPGQPDLVVGAPSVNTSQVSVGEVFTLSATVRNRGEAATAPTTLRYYRSDDATISSADTPAGTDAVIALGADGSSGESIALTAPGDAGMYYYGACVDSVAGESDASNNCSPGIAVAVTQPRPDLLVQSPSVSNSSPDAGDPFTLSVTVRNGGDGDAGASTLRYYRSVDAVIGDADTLVGTGAVAGLAVQDSSDESIMLNAPADAGTYYYGACVVAVTDESNTSNNCSSAVAVTVPDDTTGNPDLVVESPSVSENVAAPGTDLELSATVRNIGNGDAGATTLSYYRSREATMSTSDTEVGTAPVAALLVSGSSDHSITVAMPSTENIYYFRACATSVTDETNLSNNCSASVAVTVEEPTFPDLVVGTPTVSASNPETSEDFTLSATVTNQGDADAATTTLRYYRSADSTVSTSDTAVGTDPVAALAVLGRSNQSATVTAPSTAGTYYYGACVDTVADESDTENNCSDSVEVTVEEPTYPDLVVGMPTVSERNPATSEDFTLSATVTNQGDADAATTALRYYRSADSTISTSDTAVGTDSVAALAVSGSSGYSTAVTAPSTAGTYYYGACVDTVADESDTENNCSGSVEVTVEEPTYPDLVVGTPTVSESNPETSEDFTLSATVTNQGDADAATTTLRYYRSADSTVSTSDTAVGTAPVAALAVSGESNQSATVTAPSTAGTYYYGACVDTVADESDTENNCSDSVEVTVEEPTYPDLVVGMPTVSASNPETSEDFTLSATVTNQGDADAATTTLRYYRSADSTVSTSDTAVGTDSVAALAVSGSSGHSTTVTAPSTAGTYYYGACVDTVADESDTENNCSGSVEVTVEEPTYPDLVVGTPTVSESNPATGEDFTLSATVTNQGDADAATTTLRYYRSTDSTVSTSDTAVGTDSVAALLVSGSSGYSTTVTAPSTAGTYYYGACVDTVADESDTENNCSGSVEVTVEEPTYPDLVVGTPTVSESNPETSEDFTLSATVTNQGDADAATTTLRYYRSTDSTISTSDTAVNSDSVAALLVSGSSDHSTTVTAPSTAGTYYYGACVDTVADESNTANNCSASVEVSVEQSQASDLHPDLVVGTPTVSNSSPVTGGSFTLSTTVVNYGNAAAPATTLRYRRLAPEDLAFGTGVEVGTDPVVALAVSGTSEESIDLTAPPEGGTYYYDVCVDVVENELITANNCSSTVTVEVNNAPAPDLVVPTATVDNSDPDTGDSFTLSATVANSGELPAAATTLRYYRSTDSTITTSDRQEGTDPVGALAVEGTSAHAKSLTAPSRAGTYYYGACVDAVEGELDTTNNCSLAVEVIARAPDLQVSDSYTVQWDYLPGAEATFVARVVNVGNKAAPASTLRWKIGGNPLREFASVAVPALEPGGSFTSRATYRLSSVRRSRVYAYQACVDAVANESETVRNCYFFVKFVKVTYIPIGDLRVSIPEGCPLEVDICVRDTSCVDGDTVRVSVNNAVLFTKELTRAWACESATVMTGQNTIEAYAVNHFIGRGCGANFVNTGEFQARATNQASTSWSYPAGGTSTATLHVAMGEAGTCP